MTRDSNGRFVKGCKATPEEIKKRSGWHHTSEARNRISKNNTKYWKVHSMSNEHRENIGKARVGVKLSEETKTKMSEAHKGATPWNKGKKMSENFRKDISERQRGERSHFWKGGVADENKLIRSSIEYELWREDIFARDNWTCQECGKRGCTLNAHHIKPFAEHPELRVAIDNGVTLCEDCHKKIHNLNTKK